MATGMTKAEAHGFIENRMKAAAGEIGDAMAVMVMALLAGTEAAETIAGRERTLRTLALAREAIRGELGLRCAAEFTKRVNSFLTPIADQL